MLFRGRDVARAISPWVAVALVLVGLGGVAFDTLVARPERMRFQAEGRHVIGKVTGPAYHNPPAIRQVVTYSSSVGVDDAELGPQNVVVAGTRPVGQTVPLLCLTPLHRCASAEAVAEDLAAWPLSGTTMVGASAVALGALLGLWARTHRRRGRVPT